MRAPDPGAELAELFFGLNPIRVGPNPPLGMVRCSGSARAEHHHGLAFDVDQALFFQRLQYTSHHLARATDDPADLLARNLDLHAIRMGHRVGLLAEVEQRACDAAGDVEEGEVADLAVVVRSGGPAGCRSRRESPGLVAELVEIRRS